MTVFAISSSQAAMAISHSVLPMLANCYSKNYISDSTGICLIARNSSESSLNSTLSIALSQ